MTPQIQMLQNMLKLIMQRESKTKAQAYERLLTVIAGQFYFETPIHTDWIKADLHEELLEMLDIDLLRESRFDWIGELHKIEKINLFSNKILVSEEELQSVPLLDLKERHYPYRILDEQCGTGRMILHQSNSGVDCIFYAIEDNLTAYRVALLNSLIYNIKVSILHADPKVYDIRPHSPNWRLTNAWEPETRFMIKEKEVDERKRPNREGLINIV